MDENAQTSQAILSLLQKARELETSTWAAMYYLNEDHPRRSLLPGSGAA